MSYPVFLHPDVEKFIDSSQDNENKRFYEGFKKLSTDPFKPRFGCNIKKMSDDRSFYILKVGDHNFMYVIKGDVVMVEEAFKRENGY